jgi:hypothetical protein
MTDYNSNFVDAQDIDQGYNDARPCNNIVAGNPVILIHYYKRAWRTETSTYVYWSTTDVSGAYPGSGTLYPLLGAVLYIYTT